jgi:type II secretory pathway component GspD/PulD (secretin)
MFSAICHLTPIGRPAVTGWRSAHVPCLVSCSLGLWVGLMLLLFLTPGALATPPTPLGDRLHVAVHEGQLSVDLREVPVRDVLAAIGQQAGLRVHVGDSANRTVNAQFTDMELDQGLRRLLRSASLSYTLLYTRGQAATVILQEVRVFDEARGAAPASIDRAPEEVAQRPAALLTPPWREEAAEPESDESVQEPEQEPEQETDAPQD